MKVNHVHNMGSSPSADVSSAQGFGFGIFPPAAQPFTFNSVASPFSQNSNTFVPSSNIFANNDNNNSDGCNKIYNGSRSSLFSSSSASLFGNDNVKSAPGSWGVFGFGNNASFRPPFYTFNTPPPPVFGRSEKLQICPKCGHTYKEEPLGSRVVPYSPTFYPGDGNYSSISCMPPYEYNAKSHEELRWEDYQLQGKSSSKSNATGGRIPTPTLGQQQQPQWFLPGMQLLCFVPVPRTTTAPAFPASAFATTPLFSQSATQSSPSFSQFAFNPAMQSSFATTPPSSQSAFAPPSQSWFATTPPFFAPVSQSSFATTPPASQSAFGTTPPASQSAFATTPNNCIPAPSPASQSAFAVPSLTNPAAPFMLAPVYGYPSLGIPSTIGVPQLTDMFGRL